VLTGIVTLQAGVVLTLASGTAPAMGPNAQFQVDGTPRAVAAAPITFTSAALTPKPGDWQAFRVENTTASKTIFRHVRMLYGASDQQSNVPGMLLIRAGASIEVSESSFAHGSNGGIYVDDASQPVIIRGTFSSVAGSTISVPAADQQLAQDNTYGPGQQHAQVRS